MEIVAFAKSYIPEWVPVLGTRRCKPLKMLNLGCFCAASVLRTLRAKQPRILRILGKGCRCRLFCDRGIAGCRKSRHVRAQSANRPSRGETGEDRGTKARAGSQNMAGPLRRHRRTRCRTVFPRRPRGHRRSHPSREGAGRRFGSEIVIGRMPAGSRSATQTHSPCRDWIRCFREGAFRDRCPFFKAAEPTLQLQRPEK